MRRRRMKWLGLTLGIGNASRLDRRRSAVITAAVVSTRRSLRRTSHKYFVFLWHNNSYRHAACARRRRTLFLKAYSVHTATVPAAITILITITITTARRPANIRIDILKQGDGWGEKKRLVFCCFRPNLTSFRPPDRSLRRTLT